MFSLLYGCHARQAGKPKKPEAAVRQAQSLCDCAIVSGLAAYQGPGLVIHQLPGPASLPAAICHSGHARWQVPRGMASTAPALSTKQTSLAA